MAGKKENLLLLGATGNIGIHILEAIIQAKESFGRIAILTSPGTVKSKEKLLGKLITRGVDVLVGDVTKEEDILKAYEGLPSPLSHVLPTLLLRITTNIV